MSFTLYLCLRSFIGLVFSVHVELTYQILQLLDALQVNENLCIVKSVQLYQLDDASGLVSSKGLYTGPQVSFECHEPLRGEWSLALALSYRVDFDGHLYYMWVLWEQP